MKLLTIILCSGLTGLTAPAHAAPAKLENIKQIVCESTVSYDEDTPNEKKPTHGVKTFTPGSRKDVKPRPGAFLLAESENADGSGQEAFDNQQFYFSPIKNGKLSFRFIAACTHISAAAFPPVFFSASSMRCIPSNPPTEKKSGLRLNSALYAFTKASFFGER